jgi:hypothetical protein
MFFSKFLWFMQGGCMNFGGNSFRSLAMVVQQSKEGKETNCCHSSLGGHYCFLVLVITWYASAVGECRADQLGPRWTLDTQISSIRMQKRDSGLRNNKLSMERNKDDKNDTSNWVNAH